MKNQDEIPYLSVTDSKIHEVNFMFKLPAPPAPSKEDREKNFRQMLVRQMTEASEFARIVRENQTVPMQRRY